MITCECFVTNDLFVESQKMSAKGISRNVHYKLNHEKFVSALFNQTSDRLINMRIASQGQEVFTLASNKQSLNCFDDKRFILSDGINTLPYGHYSLNIEAGIRLIVYGNLFNLYVFQVKVAMLMKKVQLKEM